MMDHGNEIILDVYAEIQNYKIKFFLSLIMKSSQNSGQLLPHLMIF